MAPLPNPRTPSDAFMHDIAVSLRQLAGRDDEPDGQVELREPVKGVDATPTVHTSKGKPTPSGDSEPKGDSPSNGAVDLDSMKRDELDAHAVKLGVSEPDKLPNKDAVKAAIAEAS